MMPFRCLVMGNSGLDQQVVTTGLLGVIPDRYRGFSTALAIGSIVDGTSNIYAGAAITELYHFETDSTLHLKITGAVNSGWTTMTIVGQASFLRSAAGFAANEWTWAGIGTNPWGGAGTVRTVIFT